MIVLLRHGETEWSRAKKHTGLTDLPLTDTGREQARAAARFLEGREFALALTSPLQRAMETAELAGIHAPEPEPGLVEWDYGDAEGRTTEEMREDIPGWDVWKHGPPGGETAEAVGVRADRVITRARQANGDVILVAHGHLLRILAARWLEQPATFGGQLRLDTAAVCELDCERDRRAILRWNLT